jgi:light-regulated signal transduction histidine kinase (bacteriophytochrome)
MQDLINDLLTFSRVGRTTETFTPVDVAAVVDDVLEVLAQAVDDAGATVTVGELPVVTGDRRLLGAALQNLIGNALKFRGEAPPRVDIAATLTAAPGGRAGDEWVISVADNGIGIQPDYGEQIFVIFKRLHAKTEYAGTGIGLALTKKIIEFHEGRIWLEPTEGPGSTFRFTLPARSTTTTTPSTTTPPPTATRSETTRSETTRSETRRSETTPPITAPPTTEQPAAALPAAERGSTDAG